MIDGQKRGFMQFQDVRAFLDSILGFLASFGD